MRKHTWRIGLPAKTVPKIVAEAFPQNVLRPRKYRGHYILHAITYDPITDEQENLLLAKLSEHGLEEVSCSSQEENK